MSDSSLISRGLRAISGRWLLRRGFQELRLLRLAIERQTVLLDTLVNRMYPPAESAAPDVDGPDAPGEVDHLDPVELALVLEWEAKVQQQTGHRPSEDEVMQFLADEKTRTIVLETGQAWRGRR